MGEANFYYFTCLKFPCFHFEKVGKPFPYFKTKETINRRCLKSARLLSPWKRLLPRSATRGEGTRSFVRQGHLHRLQTRVEKTTRTHGVASPRGRHQKTSLRFLLG